MIDIENIVISTVKTAVQTAYPACAVYGVYVEAPSTFPCVSIVEDDNYTLRQTQDESLAENHAVVMYSVNVYSNLTSGAKEQAKAIMAVVDTAMQNMKFTRTVRSQVPNLDRTIYRVVARYEAVVGKPSTIGGNTVYSMYRQQ